VNDSDGVLHIDLNRDARAWLGVKFSDPRDVFQYPAAEVLFDEQQQHISLGGEREAEKGGVFGDALSARG